MRPKLPDYEWQFLLQTVSRIYCCSTYQEALRTFAQQFQTLVKYDRDIFFNISKENGKTTLGEPFSSSGENNEITTEAFLCGNYPHWSEFIMLPRSSVFRQSDLVSADNWERSHVYRDIWLPQHIYHGLFMSVVYRDNPLLMLGVFRRKEAPDFSERDVFVLEMLKDCMEHKLYQLKSDELIDKGDVVLQKISQGSPPYSLTRREVEIVGLVCGGMSSDRMCEKLVISMATLNKHLSNIYAKTGVNSRVQLMSLFTK